MNNDDKSGGDYLVKTLELIKRYYLPFGLIVYISGFLAWNIYLSKFGFFEYNLLDTRFLSAGLLIVIPLIILYIILNKLIIDYKFRKQYYFVVLILLIFVYFMMLSYVFPKTKQSFGGGYPFVSSIIINDNKDLFKKLGVLNPDHPKDIEGIETYIGCEIYQNSDMIIMGFVIPDNNITTDSNGSIFTGISIKLFKFSRNKVDTINNFMKDKEEIVVFMSTTTNTKLSIDKYNRYCEPILEYYTNDNFKYQLKLKESKLK